MEKSKTGDCSNENNNNGEDNKTQINDYSNNNTKNESSSDDETPSERMVNSIHEFQFRALEDPEEVRQFKDDFDLSPFTSSDDDEEDEDQDNGYTILQEQIQTNIVMKNNSDHSMVVEQETCTIISPTQALSLNEPEGDPGDMSMESTAQESSAQYSPLQITPSPESHRMNLEQDKAGGSEPQLFSFAKRFDSSDILSLKMFPPPSEDEVRKRRVQAFENFDKKYQESVSTLSAHPSLENLQIREQLHSHEIAQKIQSEMSGLDLVRPAWAEKVSDEELLKLVLQQLSEE